MTDLNEMWAALEAHKPKPKYAKAWRRMCRKRNAYAAWDAWEAAAAAKARAAAEAGIRAKAGAAWATVAIMYIAEAEELKNYEF